MKWTWIWTAILEDQWKTNICKWINAYQMKFTTEWAVNVKHKETRTSKETGMSE